MSVWDSFFTEAFEFLITLIGVVLIYFILTTPTVIAFVKRVHSNRNEREKAKNLTKYLSKDKKKEFKKNLKNAR